MKKRKSVYDSFSYGDILGDFGVKFVAPNPFSTDKDKRAFFICPICNKEFEHKLTHIKVGRIKRCCKEVGVSETRLYEIWSNMKTRVFNTKFKYYSDYGGRGITVCDAWLNFPSFQYWALNNGYQDSLTLDRENNDLGYCPENCRWITSAQQTRNKRNNVWWVLDGQRLCETDVATLLGRASETPRHWRRGVSRMPPDIKARVTSIIQNGVELLGNVR
jgi:hypothetical protein